MPIFEQYQSRDETYLRLVFWHARFYSASILRYHYCDQLIFFIAPRILLFQHWRLCWLLISQTSLSLVTFWLFHQPHLNKTKKAHFYQFWLGCVLSSPRSGAATALRTGSYQDLIHDLVLSQNSIQIWLILICDYGLYWGLRRLPGEKNDNALHSVLHSASHTAQLVGLTHVMWSITCTRQLTRQCDLAGRAWYMLCFLRDRSLIHSSVQIGKTLSWFKTLSSVKMTMLS